MAISAETIDKIRINADILEVVREYLPNMKKAGRNWKANCPFHHEKTPSFIISPEKGIFHCFGCNAGGDVFKFVMQMDNISWPEAVKKLAAKAGIVVTETRDEILQRSEKQKIYDILENASNFYHRYLTQSDEGSAAVNYLKKRGVSAESIKNFMLGYAPSGALVNAAGKKKFSNEDLVSSGLLTKRDRGGFYEYMSNRLVFPIMDVQGRVVAFGGRTLKQEEPKYLNSPETGVYSKSHQLYGLFNAVPALRHEKEVIILEGYMDVVVMHQYGITNSVATLGTALTQSQTHILARYVEKVILLFDADSAGRAATRRAIENLVESDMVVKVAFLPENIDADEYLVEHGSEDFIKLLKSGEKSSIEFMVGQAVAQFGKATPEAKAKIVGDVIPVIDKVRNAVLKDEWVKYLAQELIISEESVRIELKRLKRSKYSKSPGTKVSADHAQRSFIRSTEEEILQVLAAFPELCGKVNKDIFKVEKNSRIFNLLSEKITVSNIANRLEGPDISWFSELILEEKHYSDPEQTLTNMLRDAKQSEMETKRQELEKEVILMINGKIPLDHIKIELYQRLNKELKGAER